MLKKIITILLTASTSTAIAADYSQDTGIITKLYASAYGGIAVQIDTGFVDAITDNQCPTNNGWAGNNSADSVLKSAILAAKTTGEPITITTLGCDGGWIKIVDVYLE